MIRNSIQATELFVRTIARTAIENEQYFSELDGVVGDGDFGFSLAAGFTKVSDQWESLKRDSPGAILKSVALVIASRVGGVSGAIWGTAFLRASAAAGAKQDLTHADVIAMFRAACEGIKERGQSDLGDKTLLDALVPAVDAFAGVMDEGGDTLAALEIASQTARSKAEETKAWIAKRGRAAYCGERSRNTYDAGAVAVAVMSEALLDAWRKASLD